MRKITLFLLLSSFMCGICFGAEDWNTVKSTHFIVYYKKSPEDFVSKVSQEAEEFYDKITSDLGFNRFDFWLWDNRAKIYIYDDAAQFQAVTGKPAWVGGFVVPATKTIQTFSYAKNLFDYILAHEMGHIIFREFVGFSNYTIPLWLEEGVASYQEKAKYSGLYPLLALWRSDSSFMDMEKLSQFSTLSTLDAKTAQVFYVEAFSVVDFLMKEFGRDKFVLFCQNLRDKNDFQRALVSTYSFSNIGELDSAWQKYLWHE
ncbi:MAG: peptidase MA family metallohydrolase [Candidatus Omnitrophota bacterium]